MFLAVAGIPMLMASVGRVFAYRPKNVDSTRPQAFPQVASFARDRCHSLVPLPTHPVFLGNLPQNSGYSSGTLPPSSSDSKRVELFRKAILTRPVGPLRCLAMMISA